MRVAGFVFASGVILASAAFAQAPAQPPPTDAEMLRGQLQLSESRGDYLTLMLRRMQAEEAKTAQWWADYIGAKPEPATPK